MNATVRARSAVLALGLLSSCALTACAGEYSPTSPSAPQPIAQPSPPPTGLQPTVTAITPNVGSTAGGAWGTINGNEFQPGATVTLGNTVVGSALVRDRTTVLFWTTAPHAAGTVDVTVTNPGGLIGRLIGAYTHAPPQSFDVNGDWVAHAGPEYETAMRISIRNNALVSFSCGVSGAVIPSVPVPISGGEFAFRGEDGTTISGTVVSPENVHGSINTPACPAARWWADKNY
jgi:hypothetical protein